MKKSLLALAALTAFAGVASAQSSVTLFGIVDLAARSVKNGTGNGGAIKSLSADGSSASRLGFRGIEDLGGGMRAGFWLESGMSADTGAVGAPSGAFFNRRATVSLMGGFGEIRLGRDYTPTFWNHTVFDPFGTQGVASANNLINPGVSTGAGAVGNTTRVLGVPGAGAGDARTGTFVRADNSIGYFLPAVGGLYGQLMVAAGEGVVGNKYTGGRLGYAAGPVNVAAAYGRTLLSLSGHYETEWNVAGSFAFGPVTLWAQYSDFDVDAGEPATATSYGAPGNRNMKNGMLGLTWTMGPGTLKLTAAKTKGDLNTGTTAAATTALDASATQLGVGYVYDLSKRTALYTAASRIKNKKGAHFYAGAGGPAYTGTTANFTSTGYEFGLRHNF